MAAFHQTILTADKLSDLYERQRMSFAEIAKEVGCNPSTVRYYLKKHGIHIRTKDEWFSDSRKKAGKALQGRERITPELREKLNAGIRLHHDATASGVSLKPSGYLEYTRGKHKGRSVHVVAAEKSIGRRLLSGEHVHHIDGNKLNNSPENLRVLTISEHAKIHALENHHLRERDSHGRFV